MPPGPTGPSSTLPSGPAPGWCGWCGWWWPKSPLAAVPFRKASWWAAEAGLCCAWWWAAAAAAAWCAVIGWPCVEAAAACAWCAAAAAAAWWANAAAACSAGESVGLVGVVGWFAALLALALGVVAAEAEEADELFWLFVEAIDDLLGELSSLLLLFKAAAYSALVREVDSAKRKNYLKGLKYLIFNSNQSLLTPLFKYKSLPRKWLNQPFEWITTQFLTIDIKIILTLKSNSHVSVETFVLTKHQLKKSKIQAFLSLKLILKAIHCLLRFKTAKGNRFLKIWCSFMGSVIVCKIHSLHMFQRKRVMHS